LRRSPSVKKVKRCDNKKKVSGKKMANLEDTIVGLKNELVRVRNYKKNADAMVEFLFKENEERRLVVRVNQEREYREKLTEKILEMLLDKSKIYFTNPIEKIIYESEQKDIFCIEIMALIENEERMPFPTKWENYTDLPEYPLMLKKYLEKNEGEDLIEVSKVFKYWENKAPYKQLVKWIKVKSLTEIKHFIGKNLKEIIKIEIK
jgi:hypothetical protein